MRRLAPVVALLALGGCYTLSQGLPGSAGPVPGAYARALSAHTRSAHVYRYFAQKVMVAATLETPDFLEARFTEDGRIHALAETGASARLDTFETGHPGITAVVYMEAARPEWLDLASLDPTWRVALEVGGHAYDATHIESLDTDDATLRHLFPYIRDFGAAWLVDFPAGAKAAATEKATLVVAGAPARVRLVFPAGG